MMIEEGSCVFSFVDEEEKRKRDVYVLKKDLEQIDATESCSIGAICMVSALLRRILRV